MNIKDRLYLSTIDFDAVEVAKEYDLGIELAEFCTAMFMDEKYFSKFDTIAREKLAATKRHIMHAPFNELIPCAIEPRALVMAKERLDEAYELAKTYGISKMVVHSGHMPVLYFDEWFVERSVIFWQDYMKDKDDLELFVENVFEENPYALAKMIKEVNNERVKICFDVGHAYCKSNLPLSEWIDVFGAMIGHMHIHNNDSSYDLHNPLGEGNIDFASVFEIIENRFPWVTYTLEDRKSKLSIDWLLENGLLSK